MFSFAILSLALSILIWMLCYGLLSATRLLADGIKGAAGTLILVGICVYLIFWGIHFIVNRWPSHGCY